MMFECGGVMKRRTISRDRVSQPLGWIGLAISILSATPLLADKTFLPMFGVILCLGLAIVGFAIAIHLSDTVFEWFVVVGLGGKVLDIRTCRSTEIPQVHSLAENFFGESVTAPETIGNIVSKYRDGLQVAIGHNSERELSVRGYYFLFPINKRCVDRIHDYTFTVAQLTSDDIATKPKYGHALYIGAVAARGVIARAELMGAIKTNAERASQTRSGVAYARAATKRGRDLLLENGFEPVHPYAVGLDCFFKKSFRSEAVA